MRYEFSDLFRIIVSKWERRKRKLSGVVVEFVFKFFFFKLYRVESGKVIWVLGYSVKGGL